MPSFVPSELVPAGTTAADLQRLSAAPAGVLPVLVHGTAAVFGTIGELGEIAVVLAIRTPAGHLATIVVEAQVLGSGRHGRSVPRRINLWRTGRAASSEPRPDSERLSQARAIAPITAELPRDCGRTVAELASVDSHRAAAGTPCRWPSQAPESGCYFQVNWPRVSRSACAASAGPTRPRRTELRSWKS